jgi:hypothetical protein
MRLQVRLPNGVNLDLGEAGLNELSAIMQMDLVKFLDSLDF